MADPKWGGEIGKKREKEKGEGKHLVTAGGQSGGRKRKGKRHILVHSGH